MTESATTPKLSLRLYSAPEELPEHLLRYCQSPDQTGTNMFWFKHPLYVSFFPVVAPCEIGELIAFRERAFKRELEDRNWGGVFAALERAFRLYYLLDLVREGMFEDADNNAREAKRFWKLASELWSDCEESEDEPVWSQLMSCGVPNRGFMTRSQDRRALRQMPNTVRVYRGVRFDKFERPDPTAAANAGWAWSFSEKTATWFARRFSEPGDNRFLVSADLPKSMIVAYITGRGEEEVLIEPGSVDPKIMKTRAV